MRFGLFALVLAFLVVSVPADENVEQFVVNGEDASIADYPYMAKVHNFILPVCGGAILTDRSVLTAAHCLLFRSSQPGIVSVTVGSSHRRGQNGQRYPSLRLLMHPDYVPGPNVNDVAVIYTVSRIEFGFLVQPVALATGNLGVGVAGVFTGWGFVSYGPILPRRADLLQKMDVITISNEECREMYSDTHRAEFVVDQKVCIVSTTSTRTSVCGGDSGSPLIVNGAVAGVVSWRTNPCGDGRPDVFIRISAVRDWINSVI